MNSMQSSYAPGERVSVAVYFAVLGLLCATWSSSIDDVKLLLGLNDAQQGWLLFSGPVGSLVSYTFVSALVTRLGSRRSLVAATCALLLASLALASCFLFRAPVPAWCVALALFGGTCSIVNISVNTQGGIVERKSGRTIMSSFHAMYSVTCLAAGLLALLAADVGLPPGWRLVTVFAASAAAHAVFFRGLPKESDVVRKAKGEGVRRPDVSLALLGLAAFVIMGCEGAVFNWVGVFYRDTLAASAGRAKWGFCAVSAMMAFGRFLTDRFVNRFGGVCVMRVHCALVAAGLGVALASPRTGLSGLPLHLLATAGFALAGYGISALAPILYSKANRSKAMPAASAVSFIGSMGFFGCFMGPPLIGHIAQATSLSVAFGLFAVAILGCLFLRLADD